MNIPEGYVLVPTEPTEEMLGAMWSMMNSHSGGTKECYASLISEAPEVELTAYDEAKERELFEACNPKPRGVEWSLKSSRYIGSSDHFAISVYQSGWDGWKACAKSRAGNQP